MQDTEIDRKATPDRKPEWLRISTLGSSVSGTVRKILRSHNLNTVCNEALCPNRGHCYDRGTATFLIMGKVCTRSCGYCAINRSESFLDPLDPLEPGNVAAAAEEMGLKYVVITSVTRDDLDDGGASHFHETVLALRQRINGVKIEVLTPDFKGSMNALRTIAESAPDVFNHNLETTEKLFSILRPVASYRLSLQVLRAFKSLAPQIMTKSGIMLGLGETDDDIRTALQDLRNAKVDIVTMGQYLRPGRSNVPVARYVTPDEFDSWREFALGLGVRSVASGPLVRSSYHADLALENE